MATVSAAGVVGLPAFSGSVVAQTDETLYLTDTGGDGTGYSDKTVLYEVDLVTEGGTDKAKLTLLKEITDSNFGRVDAMAATPDGEKLHLVDTDTAYLGEYDVDSGTFTDKGQIAGLSGGDGIVLAAYSPDGTLYVAGQVDDEVFTVDPSGPTASAGTAITGVDVQGADIAFDADGTLYLYSSADGHLYTVDLGTGAATEVGGADSQSDKGGFTGLAVRENGTGDLVGSATSDDTVWVLDRLTGVRGTGYRLYSPDGTPHDYGFGDMTVGELDICDTTLDLCAGQDTRVGTVTVTDDGAELSVTYEMDPDEGWLLYETHVDIGDEVEDLHTNPGGNPTVGRFDLSDSHDGVTSFTYTVDCTHDALSDVAAGADTLDIAAHAVVAPVDGCVDFSGFEAGDSVEGFGAINPVLDVQSTSGVPGAEAVAQKEGVTPGTYGAPNGSGTTLNGCLDDYHDDPSVSGGFSDVVTKDAGAPHAYEFTVADGATLSEFSLRMLDYGDYNPDQDERHFAAMVASDADGNEVDRMELEYYTNAQTNPSTAWKEASHDTVLWSDLDEQGDACDAVEGEPGNWVWEVSGEGIVTVELAFGDGHDPNIAFTDLCYTASDETAWVCSGQAGVERFVEQGNWATHFEYATCAPFEACEDENTGGESTGGSSRGPPGR